MTHARHRLGDLLFPVVVREKSPDDADKGPVTVETPSDRAFGALGPVRMGGQYRPPLPSPSVPVTSARIIDAVVDSAIAPTWALTYLPPTNAVGVGDPMEGATPFTAAGTITAPWPAASGFPAGTELIDSRGARGVLQLGQGGARSGPVVFDWSAGGVLQVPAGALQLDVDFPLGSVGVSPPVPLQYPGPLVPSYSAFVSKHVPARPQGHLTQRQSYVSGAAAGTLTALMFAVPIGARSWYVSGFGPDDGRLEGILTGATGRAVTFNRRRQVTSRETMTFFLKVQTPQPLAADTVAVGIQLAGAAAALPYTVSVGFEMSW